jgi:pimeloyl-ACP methyl ester carboxylesterase
MRIDFSVPSGRATLAAERDGEGPVVVCLHAGVCDRRMWRPLAAALGGSRRVVAYDRRGFGGTPAVDEARSHVDDLFAVLDDAEVGSPAVLVGCSQGGRIAIDAALQSPERVRALVLVGSAVSGAPEPLDPPAPIQRLGEAIEEAEKAGDIDRVNRLEAHLWLDGPLAAEGRVAGDLRRLFLEMNGVALAAAPMPAMIEAPSAYQRLGQLAVPTLVMWGDLDLPHVVANNRHVADCVPGAKAHVVDGAAHLPTLEQPERSGTVIAAFLDEVERRK